MEKMKVSERRACHVVKPRSTQRAVTRLDAATERLIDRMVELACQLDAMATGE